MAQFDKQLFSQKDFFFMHNIVCAKYQNASVKALVHVDFPVYALSKHKQNPYLKGKRK